MKKVLFLSIFLTAGAQAQLPEKCKPLEKLIGNISDKKRYNYSSVNKIMTLSQSSKCDDGSYAQGMSDIVVQSLAKDFVRTMKVASKNEKALNFVVAHVNSTTGSKDLAMVTENAQKICPKDKRAACMKVDEAARSAMRAMN